jgi:SAM-dependent methyltransferase
MANTMLLVSGQIATSAAAPRPIGVEDLRRNLPLILVVLAFIGVVVAFYEMKDHRPPDVPFVTTPTDVVEAMLVLADVNHDDIVYDLGCGDGRMVITAARKHGCRGLGVDIDPARVSESRANAEAAGVQGLVKFRHKDIFDLDLSEATVVMMFLQMDINQKLEPQFAQMKPGSRIVSHQFRIPGVKPRKVIQVRSKEDMMEHPVYLFVTPLERE